MGNSLKLFGGCRVQVYAGGFACRGGRTVARGAFGPHLVPPVPGRVDAHGAVPVGAVDDGSGLGVQREGFRVGVSVAVVSAEPGDHHVRLQVADRIFRIPVP